MWAWMHLCKLQSSTFPRDFVLLLARGLLKQPKGLTLTRTQAQNRITTQSLLLYCQHTHDGATAAGALGCNAAGSGNLYSLHFERAWVPLPWSRSLTSICSAGQVHSGCFTSAADRTSFGSVLDITRSTETRLSK